MKEALLEVGGNGDDVKKSSKPKRVYYIDWMRVVSIYLVASYHIIQALDWVGFYDHFKGGKEFVVGFRASSLQVGMPMFFHISGRAHALSPPMGFYNTVVKRAKRLLLPFCIAYVLLVPPWQYIDKEYDWAHPSLFHMKANPIEWLLTYYTTSRFFFYFDMAWLWFLPALYLIIVFSSPLFIVAERYKADKGLRWNIFWSFVIWISMGLLLQASGFKPRFIFFTILGPFTAVAFAQWSPLPAAGARPEEIAQPMRMWLAMHGYTLVQVACSVGIVLSFGYAEIDPPQPGGGHSPRAGVPFFILCLGFYIHGYFIQRWGKGGDIIEEGENSPWWIWQYKLVCCFIVLLTLMLTSPRGDVESGHFIYPIYSTTYKAGSGWGAMHVLGTWAQIGIFVALFQAYCNNQGGAWFHKHATRSAMIVYIFHWIFIKIFAFWWLTPTLWRLRLYITNPWIAVVISLVALVVCTGLSLVVYMLLCQSKTLGGAFGL